VGNLFAYIRMYVQCTFVCQKGGQRSGQVCHQVVVPIAPRCLIKAQSQGFACMNNEPERFEMQQAQKSEWIESFFFRFSVSLGRFDSRK